MSAAPLLPLPTPPVPRAPTPINTPINPRQELQPTTAPRNLVLIFDGTDNTFSSSLTSLPVLYSLLSADPIRQLCYYQTGIGTYEPPWTPSGVIKIWTKLLDAAIATGLGDHVRDGYTYLMQYYQPGDNIYVFGFSRGAFTARALAGMVQQVGILMPGNEQSVNLAYHIYSEPDEWLVKPKCGNKDCQQCGELLAAAFKRSFSREAHIHFVGVWDTVSSVGAIVPRTLPFAAGGRAIAFFRQALSLDEHRARFQPQLWMPDDSEPPSLPCLIASKFDFAPPPLPPPHRCADEPDRTDHKEVWFAGCHSDCGGGETISDGDYAPRLSHLPLRWMIREAFDRGLALDLDALVCSPVYAPFLSAATAALASPFPTSSKLPPPDPLSHAGKATSPVEIYIDKLVHVATEPSDRLDAEAVAPRGDALSFRIQHVPNEGFLQRIKGIGGRWNQRAKTMAWWIVEVSPALRIVWDVEGDARKRTIGWHLGRGRDLPPGAILHESVKIRESARPAAFAHGNGSNVPESNPYRPKAKFVKGDASVPVYEF